MTTKSIQERCEDAWMKTFEGMSSSDVIKYRERGRSTFSQGFITGDTAAREEWKSEREEMERIVKHHQGNAQAHLNGTSALERRIKELEKELAAGKRNNSNLASEHSTRAALESRLKDAESVFKEARGVHMRLNNGEMFIGPIGACFDLVKDYLTKYPDAKESKGVV